ncbi:TPA: hypothetical protein KD879_004688 [Vibrio parahaemolyticus]|nr:hypothetical protein [Vibrio vulnificus]HBC3926831.1 hypothetical protein [Vibrio parahaemolyticus]
MNREISRALAIVASKYHKLVEQLNKTPPNNGEIKIAKTAFFLALKELFEKKDAALANNHRVDVARDFEDAMEMIAVIAIRILNRREPPSRLEMKSLEGSIQILESHTQEQVDAMEELTRSIQKSIRNRVTL